MNRQEFRMWLDDYVGHFPSVANWLNKLGDRPKERLLEDVWPNVMGATPLRDAMRITKMMSDGRLEPIGRFDSDREQTALFIKRAVIEQRRALEDHHRPRDLGGVNLLAGRPRVSSSEPGDPEQPVANLMSRVDRLIRSGRTSRHAARELISDDDDERRHPRYQCLTCEDSGLVVVWHHLSMLAWKHEVLAERKNRRTMCCPCHCKAAAKMVWDSERDGAPPMRYRGWRSDDARYHPDRHCLVNHGDVNSDEAIEEFSQWCEGFFSRLASKRADELYQSDFGYGEDDGAF